MQQTSANPVRVQMKLPGYLQNWWYVPVILFVALLFRIGYIPNRTGIIDEIYWTAWAKSIAQDGLFSSYHYVEYPPLFATILYSISMIQTALGLPIDIHQPVFFTLLKLVPVIADLMMIGAVAIWLRGRKLLRWVIPIWLAVSPGLLIISTWRGQVDSLVTLFIVLALIAFNRDRPRLAWGMFALAMLTKQTAFFTAALIPVLTFRRYGWRETLTCAIIFTVIHLVVLFPFMVTTGVPSIINIYFGFAQHTNSLNLHGPNLWYLVYPTYPAPATVVIWGAFTARHAAYLLFGVYSLIVLAHVWRSPKKAYEFVWAAALNIGFFLFLVGVFERYLYYPTALFTIAVVQEGQLLGVALALTYTCALANIKIWIAGAYEDLGNWLGWFLWWGKFYVLGAMLNVGVSFEALRILGSGGRRFKWFFQLTRIATVAVAVVLVYVIVRDPLSFYPTAAWLTDHIASATDIATENLEVVRFAQDRSPVGVSSNWRLVAAIDSQTIPEWRASGVDYLIVDEWAHPGEDFTARVNQLVAQGGTLLYETGSLLRLNSRQAVVWTSQPQKQTHLLFDGSLQMLGYDLLPGQESDSLVVYWYVERIPLADFHVFVHLTDAADESIVGQADTVLGQFVHPPSTWQLHEIVVERYALPARPGNRACTLQLGLYHLSTGQRAVITDQTGRSLGDHLEIPIG